MDDFGFGASWSRHLLTGVFNGDFHDAPASPDSDITVDNALPYWTVSQAPAGISVRSVADASAGSGRILRGELSGDVGSSGDQFILQQWGRVSAARGQSWVYLPILTAVNATGAGGNTATITFHFYAEDGTLISSAPVFSATVTQIGAGPYDITATTTGGLAVLTVPSNASRFLLSIVWERLSGAIAAGAIEFSEVRVLVGASRVVLAESTAPGARDMATLEQRQGVLWISPDGQVPGTSPTSTAGGAIALVGERIAVPKGTQDIIAAGNTVNTSAEFCPLDASTGGITLTSTPTVADGTNGQIVTFVHVGAANTITFQDQGTLANSNLRLSATSFVMGPRDSLTLMFSSDIGDWIEVGRTNVI